MLVPDDSSAVCTQYTPRLSKYRRRSLALVSTRIPEPGHPSWPREVASSQFVLSFGRLDSFVEIRRGFEFNDSHPGFYPPSTTTSRYYKCESILSITSVSSYGLLVHSGSSDPFDYASLALPLQQWSWSYGFSFSMSTSVDDTFRSFASCPEPNQSTATHLHCPSCQPFTIAASGIIAEAIPSRALADPCHVRREWRSGILAKHRPEFSVDSILRNYSGARLDRPGLGDKMLESAFDHGTSLTAISISPSGSPAGSIRSERNTQGEFEYRTTYSSIWTVGTSRIKARWRA